MLFWRDLANDKLGTKLHWIFLVNNLLLFTILIRMLTYFHTLLVSYMTKKMHLQYFLMQQYHNVQQTVRYSERMKPHIVTEKQVTNWITLKYCWSSSSSHVLQFSLYPIRIMFGLSLPRPVISINAWHPASKLSFSVILKNAFTLCRISHWYAFLVRATWTLCEWVPCQQIHNTLVKKNRDQFFKHSWMLCTMLIGK